MTILPKSTVVFGLPEILASQNGLSWLVGATFPLLFSIFCDINDSGDISAVGFALGQHE